MLRAILGEVCWKTKVLSLHQNAVREAEDTNHISHGWEFHKVGATVENVLSCVATSQT